MQVQEITFKLAETAEEFKTAKALFREYSDSLGFSLDFQDFEKEMAEVSIKYAAPKGALWLCFVDANPVGCVGVRQLPDDTAEIKRLYVKPEYRSLKLGRQLMEKAMAVAKNLGYTHVKLDTLSNFEAAISLYKKMGFYEITAYCYNPFDNVVYMEKAL